MGYYIMLYLTQLTKSHCTLLVTWFGKSQKLTALKSNLLHSRETEADKFNFIKWIFIPLKLQNLLV